MAATLCGSPMYMVGLSFYFQQEKAVYGKFPKISNTKVHDKMTYARSSLIRVYSVCHSTKYFKKRLHKKETLGQNSME